MFMIIPPTADDLEKAMSICSCFQVLCSVLNGGEPNFQLKVIRDPEAERSEEQYLLCKLVFTLNFHKDTMVCAPCEQLGEETCNHLTFTVFTEQI